ncbi:hypothetical protein I204_01287 [Kwoniella mangroviensis CBS 8886]|uniref:uncharacterized protein n=1 Tax=Kwoniella mangroviensis CBS 8507 TaxID=1296122 RepID=UPI00080D1FFE|nr:uncharacterized protein I203_06145 [Kwoniella mangroviensis CBS 8507]OCF64900.1 hypothetical protein I203_06145 [Kwoniella mangroviensis CBS 8507]OCF77300.1 hypothetical protein I204_01287 [Kwoniella mangroviensis CBS 8886]
MSAEESTTTAAPAVDASAPAETVEKPSSSSAPAPAPATAAATEEQPKSSSPNKKPPSSKPRGRPSTGGGASNKKSTAVANNNDEKRNFEVGEIVLARLRGYPPWPARIANPDTLPRNVLKQRPGKNPLIFCCQFFPAGDFSWLQSKEIKSLSQSDISAYLGESHRKSAGGLREAYITAQDPTEWDAQQADLQQAKEDAENENEVDEIEDEEEEEATTGGKRKRAAPEKKKDGKKAKTTKSKATVDDDSKAKSKSAAKPKSTATKGSKPPASKPENQEPADDDPLASNPECVKVKDWRHKLQRAFLSKSLPSAEEMPSYDDLFKTIESYESMTIDALQYSKIGKVMKKIMTLNEIPRNEEFKITDRASKLMHQWTDFIASSENKPNGAANGEAPASTAANGEKKEEVTEKKDGEKMEVDA